MAWLIGGESGPEVSNRPTSLGWEAALRPAPRPSGHKPVLPAGGPPWAPTPGSGINETQGWPLSGRTPVAGGRWERGRAAQPFLGPVLNVFCSHQMCVMLTVTVGPGSVAGTLASLLLWGHEHWFSKMGENSKQERREGSGPGSVCSMSGPQPGLPTCRGLAAGPSGPEPSSRPTRSTCLAVRGVAPA